MNLAYHETNPVPSLHSPFENPKSHDLCCLLGVLEALPGSGEWWQTGLDDGPESRDAAHPILIPFSDPAEWADMLIRATGADEFLRRREEVKSWLSIHLPLPLILSVVLSLPCHHWSGLLTPLICRWQGQPLRRAAIICHYRPLHIETHPFIISPSHP